MIEELISRVFQTRNLAHLEHWKTKSFAQHEALGEFYEAIVGAMDSIVECYIGAFGDIGTIPVAEQTTFSVEHLQDEADWIEVNRKEISGDHDAIANLIDGLTASYLKAIYKLSRFS